MSVPQQKWKSITFMPITSFLYQEGPRLSLLTPSNFQEIAHSFVHIKSTELQEIETTVATFRWYPKVGTRTTRNLYVAPGNQQLRRKVKLMLRCKKLGRKSVSSRINQPNQPIWLVVIRGFSNLSWRRWRAN